jgi:hypothetical protein
VYSILESVQDGEEEYMEDKFYFLGPSILEDEGTAFLHNIDKH